MRSFNILAIVASLAAVATSSAIVSRENDWKYSVGWNGVTLPSSDIGTPAPSDDNSTHLEVCASTSLVVHLINTIPIRNGLSEEFISALILCGADVAATPFKQPINALCWVVTGISRSPALGRMHALFVSHIRKFCRQNDLVNHFVSALTVVYTDLITVGRAAEVAGHSIILEMILVVSQTQPPLGTTRFPVSSARRRVDWISCSMTADRSVILIGGSAYTGALAGPLNEYTIDLFGSDVLSCII
jgi:hypothetical protein